MGSAPPSAIGYRSTQAVRAENETLKKLPERWTRAALPVPAATARA